MKAHPGPHPVYEMLDGQHYSKATPLTYNLDRILHSAGAPLLGKDQQIQQKCLRHTFVSASESKV